MQRHYVENRTLKDMQIFVSESMNSFQYLSVRNIFKKCGYVGSGHFDPGKAFN